MSQVVANHGGRGGGSRAAGLFWGMVLAIFGEGGFWSINALNGGTVHLEEAM